MRTRLALLAALALPGLTACDTEPEDGPAVTELKQALPRAEAMTIAMPSGAFQVPQQATFYAFTWGTTQHVNAFVRRITQVIEDVVELPATETDGSTYAVWGPWTEPLSPATWQVRVDRQGDGYTYAVQAWPRDGSPEAAVTVLSGQHTPGADARRGAGAWTYDLSAARSVDPIAHDALGQIAVTYTLADSRQIEVTFTDVQGAFSEQATSTLYRYTETSDRAGTFDFVSNLDIDEDDPAKDRRELLQVRARWTAEGPGRADVLATHGDLPAGVQAEVSECWGPAFTRDFIQFTVAGMAYPQGDPAACAYGEAELPMFDGFDPDAFADDGLLEALPQPQEFDPPGVAVDAPVATPAVYYAMARDIIAGLRDQVGGALQIVTDITRNPPNACDARGCLWGPWTDWDTRTSFRLTIARTEGDAFAYQVGVKAFAADAEWQPLIAGGYADTAEGGQGGFTFDYDVLASFTDAVASGSARAEYARLGDRGALNVRYDALSWGEAAPIDARYFLGYGPQGGVFDLRFPFDTDEGDPARSAIEEITARVRWATSGAGVANVIVTGGDLEGEGEALAVECWDDTAARTHIDFIVRALGAERLPELDGPGCLVTDWQTADFPPLSDEGGEG